MKERESTVSDKRATRAAFHKQSYYLHVSLGRSEGEWRTRFVVQALNVRATGKFGLNAR